MTVEPPPHLAHEWSALTTEEQRDVLRWAAVALQHGALQVKRDGTLSTRVGSQRAFAAASQCPDCLRKSAVRQRAGKRYCTYCPWFESTQRKET